MADRINRKTQFILLSGIKLGLGVWLVFMVSGALYELWFGNTSFTWSSLGFALYSMVFFFGCGCLEGFLMWRKAERKD
jgi:hypothetical protein